MSDDDDPNEPEVVLQKDGTPHPKPWLVAHQFQPGQSGNPQGYHAGPLTFQQVVSKILDEVVDGKDTTKREELARVFIDEMIVSHNAHLIRAYLDREWPTPQGDAATAIAGHLRSWVEIVQERAAELEAEADAGGEVVDIGKARE